MSFMLDCLRLADAELSRPASDSEPKLTREELMDLVSARATKGDNLTRVERAAYARQLADIDFPDNPGARRMMVALMIPTRADRRASAEESARRRKPPRQPPPGKTWYDMVRGQWPGDETEEEIQAILAEIS